MNKDIKEVEVFSRRLSGEIVFHINQRVRIKALRSKHEFEEHHGDHLYSVAVESDREAG